MSKSWKDHSRAAWHTTNEPEDRCCSDDRLKIGCLQRIADALEALNQPFRQLIHDRKRWQERAEENAEMAERLRRSNRALRGYIKSKRRRAKGAGR